MQSVLNNTYFVTYSDCIKQLCAAHPYISIDGSDLAKQNLITKGVCRKIGLCNNSNPSLLPHRKNNCVTVPFAGGQRSHYFHLGESKHGFYGSWL